MKSNLQVGVLIICDIVTRQMRVEEKGDKKVRFLNKPIKVSLTETNKGYVVHM